MRFDVTTLRGPPRTAALESGGGLRRFRERQWSTPDNVAFVCWKGAYADQQFSRVRSFSSTRPREHWRQDPKE